MKKSALILFTMFFLWGCEETADKISETPQESLTPNAETQTMENIDLSSVTDLQMKVIKEGTGAVTKPGDSVLVHYVGSFLDGEKFDSSRDRGEPFNVVIGQGQVIKGWDIGLVGMKTGELRKLIIPYDMAYGEGGFPPIIPPKTPLMFEIELVEIQ